MNSSKLLAQLQQILPQIVQRPDFPKPTPSQLSRYLAHAMFAGSHCQRGDNRVTRLRRDSHSSGVLLMQGAKVAILLKEYGDSYETRYLFLTEPVEKGQVVKILPKSLFDRFNALLLLGRLPTLHQLGKDCWIFSDGVAWSGRRLFKFTNHRTQLSQKDVLQNLLTEHP